MAWVKGRGVRGATGEWGEGRRGNSPITVFNWSNPPTLRAVFASAKTLDVSYSSDMGLL
jgi:hypothetical protein